ncbi:MAG: hypothetical protein R6T91_08530 [Bacteroidales bacterium]
MRFSDGYHKYTKLRGEYQAFIYEGFTLSRKNGQIRLKFDFRLDDSYRFQPAMTLRSSQDTSHLSDAQIRELAFHIGMVELISYWKAACPKKVIIKPYKLSKPQINFWKKLYFHGLGEFFFTNGIQPSMDDFMEIDAVSAVELEKRYYHTTHHFIVPVGGGKDSAVSLQLLKEFYGDSREIIPFIMNPRGASHETVEQAGYLRGDTFIVERTIDPVLLELNNKGFLNGHTPFSALLAFTSLLISAISRNKNIVLSNESSANEPTIPGTTINHQYSKSLEFEQDFRHYVSEYISGQFEYFSLLRPLTELQIARIFSRYPQYFPHFKSCNVGSKDNCWCGKCPKCLFTFIILSPFLAPHELTGIFGRNLLDDPDQKENYLELSGQSKQKPFECVGTINEVNVSLALTVKHYAGGPSLPLLLKHFVDNGPYEDYRYGHAADYVLAELQENNIPEPLLTKLRAYLLKVNCQ